MNVNFMFITMNDRYNPVPPMQDYYLQVYRQMAEIKRSYINT
jgi:hypothetical protein